MVTHSVSCTVNETEWSRPSPTPGLRPPTWCCRWSTWITTPSDPTTPDRIDPPEYGLRASRRHAVSAETHLPGRRHRTRLLWPRPLAWAPACGEVRTAVDDMCPERYVTCWYSDRMTVTERDATIIRLRANHALVLTLPAGTGHIGSSELIHVLLDVTTHVPPPLVAHVRNGDITVTDLTVAVWRVFVTMMLIRSWARRNKVRLCFTPTNTSWANPIEAHFGPLRQFTLANSQHPNHTAQTRALHAYLRWRNANDRHPDVFAAQRRERARIRSEKGIRWGGRPHHPSRSGLNPGERIRSQH
jgi:hypothetical protein